MKKSNRLKTLPRLKTWAVIASAAVLTACATATPYQPAAKADARNGFSEMQIENDRTRISFDGNSLTDRETVETYLIYRAAELTKQMGYDHFVLTERATDKKSRIQPTGFSDPYYGFFDYSYFHPRYGWTNPYFYRPSHRSRAFGGSRFGFHDPFYSRWGGFGNDFDYREITRYKASAEVKFGRGSKPEKMDNAFTAQEVLDNLADKIIYPEVKS
jgi:hypothetical protein